MQKSNDDIFLESATKLFRYYKKLGEGAIAQLTDKEVLHKPNEASNSIALIVHHLSGNMLSRWTDFLNSDGEKTWRNREAEFEQSYPDKTTMMNAWEEGWSCLFAELGSLQANCSLPGQYPRDLHSKNYFPQKNDQKLRKKCTYKKLTER